MKHWLLKTEPETFSFDDLWNAPKRTTGWNGVRNYQARNTLRDAMKRGDKVLIYHSNADPPAVIGIAEVVREGYPEPGQETWFQVDVKALRKLPKPVPLPLIRETRALAKMALVQRGQRLSVQPVTPQEFDTIVALGSEA
ncbi:MAG TPA: EVE domain-containing protein [Myxococcales bacterium]|nr:EVE domain-containing protein [Myxococcales bacterium]